MGAASFVRFLLTAAAPRRNGGVKLGGTVDQLKAVYGSSLLPQPSATGTAFYVIDSDGGQFSFFLTGDSLQQIVLTDTVCIECGQAATTGFETAGQPAIMKEKLAILEQSGVAGG